MSGNAAFFHAMAPALTANILTVTFVYCFAQVARSERRGDEGRATHLWLIVMILMFILYGVYTWNASPSWETDEVARPVSVCRAAAQVGPQRKDIEPNTAASLCIRSSATSTTGGWDDIDKANRGKSSQRKEEQRPKDD